MAEPRKTPGIVNLQRQLDAAFPQRVKPDGWIGDSAHRGRTSSHNPDDTPGSKPEWDGDTDRIPDVRALDVNSDLGPGVSSMDVCTHLSQMPRLGTVIRYYIHQGLIWHSENDFKPVRHHGDPHPKHIHFSGAFTEAADNNTTYNYRFEDVPMALTDTDKAWLSAEIRKVVTGDADPTARAYSLGGLVTVIERRTDALMKSVAEILATLTKPPTT